MTCVQNKRTGRLAFGARVLGWPYFTLMHLRLAVRRMKSKEPLLQQVKNGWYIGGWPSNPQSVPEGPLSIIDCTNEYQRTVDRPYLCLPTWDTQGSPHSHCHTSLRCFPGSTCSTVLRDTNDQGHQTQLTTRWPHPHRPQARPRTAESACLRDEPDWQEKRRACERAHAVCRRVGIQRQEGS